MWRGMKLLLGAVVALCGLWQGVDAGEVMTNTDVVELVNAGLSEAIVREKISTSENIFDVSSKALIDLKRNKVPETLIQLMYSEALKNQKKLRARIASEIQNLASENEGSRRNAALFLKKAGSAALPQLRDGLLANTPAVRVAIVEMLGRMRDGESAAALRELLGDKDRKLRFAAAEALANIKDAPALALAKQTVKMENEPLDGCLHLLGCARDLASADIIGVRLLKSFVPETRAEAAWALGEIGGQQGLVALTDAARHDKDFTVKKNAVAALGKIAAPDSFDALIDVCRNQPAVRADVLTALGHFPAARAVPFLIASLPQPMKPEEKQAALKTLRGFTGRDFGNDLAAWNQWLKDNAASLQNADKAPSSSENK